MNQNLKDLIAQAGTDVSGKWLSLYNAEALAELIIRECANQATWHQDTNAKDIGGELLKYFGVKE